MQSFQPVFASNLALQTFVELRKGELDISDEPRTSLHVVAHLFRVDIGLDDLDILAEAGGQPEVEDPVEPGTEQNDEICLFESCGPSCTDVEEV